jgi:hypothetical protein
MDHDYMAALRREHPAWRLLASDNAPFIIAFLHRAFIQSNARSLSLPVIEEQLNDYLHHIRQSHGQDKYPLEAQAYLDEWVSGKQAFLRKYYPMLGGEPEYDLTPASEQAIQWLTSLRQREFIGTESRLLEVIELLREMSGWHRPTPRNE